MGTQSAFKRWTAGIALALCFAPTIKAQDIVLGQVGPFTVIPVPDAVEVNQGVKAYIEQANHAGGVRGHKLSLFELDDRYSADDFAMQFGKAMERKPVALLSPIGSAALARMLGDKMLDKNDVVVMNAIPGAESLRNPGHPRLFHIRSGDKQQIERIVNHVRTVGLTRLGVLYQDLVIGTSGMQMAQEEARRTGGIEIKGVKSATDAAALAAAAQEMSKLDTQGVLVIGAPRFMAEGVAALRKAGMSQTLLVLSYVPAGLIVKFAGIEGARGVGIAQTFPNPNGTTLPLHRDFHAAMKAAFPQIQQYSYFHLEGYLSARTVVEALRRSKDKEISPASLERALRSTQDFDFGGYRVHFASGTIGSRFIDFGVIGSDGKLKY
jgi:branched-chain amino acid transport system substrate-binding protein